jgi:hypothetical protein
MKILPPLIFLLFLHVVNAQPVKFTYQSGPIVLKHNSPDTLKMPFVGGFNSPQFNLMDLNGDNVKDLVVFERVGNRLYTFLRTNSAFVYAPQYEQEFPQLTNWVIIKDYNCDGLEDIFTEVSTNVQPDKSRPVFTNGLRVITNKGKVNNKFVWQQTQNQIYDTGSASMPPTNLAFGNIDYPGIVDIDNDGDLDLLFFPLGKNIISYYQNMSKELGYGCDSLIYVFRDEAWGYMYYMVNAHGFVLHDNTPWFRNYPLQKHAMHNGATFTFFDTDGDGDMELLYGDVGFNELIYLKNGKTQNSLQRDSMIYQELDFPKNTKQASLMVFPASFLLDVDFDGVTDLVVCPNAESGAKNRDQILWYKNTGTNTNYNFIYQNNNFMVADMIDLGGGAIPEFVDIDGDNDLDMVVATQGDFEQTLNDNDRLVLYKNIGNNTNPVYQLADTNFLSINAGTEKLRSIKHTFGDLNGDGKPDLIIGDFNGNIHYYTNQSNGNIVSFTKVSSNLNNIFCGTFAAPQLFDLNKDGLLDLIIGRKNGSIAYYQNNGTNTNPSFTAEPTIDSLGKITVAQSFVSGNFTFYFDGYSIPHVCDLDNDGNFEMLVGSEQGQVFLYRNVIALPNVRFERINNIFNHTEDADGINENMGKRCAVATANLTNDTIPDLIIGNNGGGLRFYKTKLYNKISNINLISNANSNNIIIYPNPTKNILTISGNVKTFEVYNLTGNKINVDYEWVSNELVLQTNLLPNGIYLLRTNNQWHKFIKQ